MATLREVRFIAVVGASGSGKSSFVRAGLLAGITATWSNGTERRDRTADPGEHPVANSSRRERRVGDHTELLDDLLADPTRSSARAATRRPRPGRRRRQFEEVFTLCDSGCAALLRGHVDRRVA